MTVMLPLVPLHARGLLHQPVPDHHRRVQPPQKQSREQSHRRTPSLRSLQAVNRESHPAAQQ